MMNGKIYHGEIGYLQMVADILNYGVDVPDRTGVGSRAMFDAKVIYKPGEFPFSTVRPMPLRMAFEEFWFMLRGKTQTKELEEKNVGFWRGNTTREFLDKRGLTNLEEGDMGQAYGWQFRGFNRGLVDENEVVDQLHETLETLKNDPYSRRLLTTLWNPSASKSMALTPCWHSHQFVVLPDEYGDPVLHLKMICRSLDSLFGKCFATQQYALYQMCMAELAGMKVGALSADLSQTHLYANQLDYAEELISRDLGVPGKVRVKRDLKTLDDMLALEWEDIEVTGLEVNKTPFVTPRPEMAA